MVNRNRNMISAALSTALVVTMLLTGSTQFTPNQPSLELAEKSAGDKKVEVVKA